MKTFVEGLQQFERYLQLMPEKEYKKFYAIAATHGLQAAVVWRRTRVRREFLQILRKRCLR